MPKIINILLLFLVLFLSNFFTSASAWNKVEDVFSDISKDYKYYNELQTLYDKGMIFPDQSWKFNAKKLLNRDEFVWISMEVTCKKCISPNTDFWLIQEYSTALTFYDVDKSNKYFYCIAEADDKWYVKWYDKWYKCENNEVDANKKPFCVDNKITLEEALAVILRNSGIFTVAENRVVIEQINAWKITEKLADDISPTWVNGGAYTFYWYFQEALDFELLEYNENGEQKIYKLLELTNNKARPGQSISKEDFLRIAYIALKANSCVEEELNELAVNIDKLNKVCLLEDENCTNKDFSLDEDTFDFSADVGWICNQWIDDEKWYTWKFYNIGTGNEVIKNWKYLDNYAFLEAWKWRVSLYVVDNCWNTWEVYLTSVIQWELIDSEEWNKTLGLQIEATPLKWWLWEEKNFICIVSWSNWEYDCVWDFGDWTTWEGINTNHNYSEPWSYVVTVTATDSDWNTSTSTVVIVVTPDDSSIDNEIIVALAANIKATPKYSKIWIETSLVGLADWWTGNYRYIWNFWDGTNWNGKDQTHLYKETWNYIVKLTIIDSKLNRANSTVSIVIINDDWSDDTNSLWVDINATPLEWDTNTTRDFKAEVEWWDWDYTYEWDFWDGSSSTGETTDHLYDDPGVYTVTLTVTDWEWNTWTSTITIVVTDWNSEENESSLWVEINASPLDWDTNTTRDFEAEVEWWDWDYTYEWDFWDGSSWTWENTDHVYDDLGVYTVILTVTDWEWNTWTSTVTIVVTDEDGNDETNSLWVSMNITPREWGVQTVRWFEGIVEWWNGDYTYEWDFWDNSNSTGENTNHLYESTWVYEVTLVVTDWEWNKGQATWDLTVTWDDWDIALGIKVLPSTTLFIWEIFNFKSIVEWWDWEYAYNWDLGDWTKSDYKNADHKYEDEWWYTVWLEVKDWSWYKKKTSVSVTVEKKKIILDWINVDFVANPFTVNVWMIIEFDSTVSNGGPNYYYSWDFWNSLWISSIDDPQYSYNTSWTYRISLSVTDDDWREGSKTATVIVVDEDVCIEWTDSDWDWISDCDNEDKCPFVPWNSINEWCPTLEQSCNNDCSCDNWYECSSKDPLQCSTIWLCKPQRVVFNACLESWQTSLIYGNISSCNACPCLQSLDFNSTLRKCDTIFPAITSRDFTQIYSRWEVFNIQ